jgi:hypothetical protein
MSWSDVTASPDFEDVRRTATLEALAHEFAPGSTPDADSAELAHDSAVILQLAAADSDSTVDGSVDDSATTMARRIIAAPQFANAWVAGSVDSSTDDSSTSLVKRIIAAKQHDEIIKVLPLLELHAVAARLDYLLACSQEDPDEPTMALASLRELALFFASEPERDEPEIGLSPDGHLQAEWRVGESGILAMKFLHDGLIQFAALSGPTGGAQPFRVNGTLPKDGALEAVRTFTSRGAL